MVSVEQWLYFNIHGIVKMRLEVGHISQPSFKKVFGSFETDALSEIDLTLQSDVPKICECSNASGSYYFNKNHLYMLKYKTHLIKQEHGYILAGKRDLLPFISPVLQMLLLKQNHAMIHSAAVSINGRGVLLPGWGGTGKTSAIICLLKEIAGSSFLSDDYTIVSSEKILAYPKAFFIYPYHRDLFPHLFDAKHKPLVPPIFSSLTERIRTIVRPTIMAFPKLESLARRITPEHMQVSPHKALPDAPFVDESNLDIILFIERYSGSNVRLGEISKEESRQRLLGNWLYEESHCGQEMIIAMSGTGFIDLSDYFSKMASVIESACDGRKTLLLRMPKMISAETGKTIVNTVKNIMQIN